MMTLSKQRKFTFNSLFKDMRGSKCCVIKVRQYTCCFMHMEIARNGNQKIGRQMAIENPVSNDFLSTFVDSINVF